MLDMFRRIYDSLISPPEVPKAENPLRFGLLGASDIAPMSLILPAKTHPEVVIACVAARDRARAEKYAKKHGIESVHDTYQDCIYIPLPNSHHYEWAIRAIKAGKHVLLEKPCTSNGAEARKLFEHPAVTAPNAPVLLEAFHYTFHPAWQSFMQLIHHDPLAGPVKSAESYFYLPRGYFGKDDIRFRAMLDDSHPVVESVEFRKISESEHRGNTAEDLEQIDEAVMATFRSKAGAVGKLVADFSLAGSILGVKAPRLGWPKCVAELEEKEVSEEKVKLADGEKHLMQRTVTLYNHIAPVIYHSIVVEDQHSIRRNGTTTVKSWGNKTTIKAYDWADKSDGHPGGTSWSTYRYQLEEFVNRVRGRKGTGVWVEHQSSIDQMDVLDEMYKKGGLKIRPSRQIDED
ncbi:uncharacterized protein BHQ10_003719 [Talaromyces amestolkiae]|uniref:D-xylose 1-dehydrogenase (NADP(+), D-xylono-1,5-lactone-forming) n=1 Tax=Talaromyces amestolkiae TaxID=1196081 RepID=A0A364KVX2_TALAM|nr:uncharacterized protein BHQ10_003719 [Talaromyces amestolkiae]RAO67707.1 hypothetical protein BHQ10_003719 [Talaromyces amestolkiae]